MAKCKTSDRNEQTSLHDAELSAVVAGCFPPVGTCAATRQNFGLVVGLDLRKSAGNTASGVMF
jgi:hypothetical protein